jgi:hypothetical protein
VNTNNLFMRRLDAHTAQRRCLLLLFRRAFNVTYRLLVYHPPGRLRLGNLFRSRIVVISVNTTYHVFSTVENLEKSAG